MALTLTEPPKNPRPGNPAPRQKNRAWGSPRFSNKTHPASRPEPKQPRRENTPCNYEIASDVRFYHKNHLDHVYAVSDNKGNILERYRYSPFGQLEIYSPTGNLPRQQHQKQRHRQTPAPGTPASSTPTPGLYMYKYRPLPRRNSEASSAATPSPKPAAQPLRLRRKQPDQCLGRAGIACRGR